ncbi:MAG: hypothetical protein HQ513_08340 [Rhodospirillales bacterium]|nr:hypothetical protein [Rhodospirillales bacterium]
MNKDEIIKKVIAILERDDPLPKGTLEVKLAYRYLDAGHIDSFAIMNFIVELEAAFDIALSSEDTQSDEFRTVGGIVTIIMERVAT